MSPHHIGETLSLGENGVILVTGGNGFLGRPFCERLFEEGAEVLSLDISAGRETRYPSIAGDISDREGLGAIFRRYPIHTVVNLAAILATDSMRDPTTSFRVNVVGSFNLLYFCRGKGVSRFVFASSYNALGDLPERKDPVDETAPCQPTDFYGASKLFVEQMGIMFSHQYGFEFAAARMPMVVGPGKPSTTSAWRAEMFNRVRSGGNLLIEFAPGEVLPLAHYQDVVEALVRLTLSERLNHAVYHLPYEAWRVEDLGRTLREVGHDLRVTYGERRFHGGPASVSWERIREEFNTETPSLRGRLLEAADASEEGSGGDRTLRRDQAVNRGQVVYRDQVVNKEEMCGMKASIVGVIPPVITAFDARGEFDEKAQREIISFLAPKVNGFYPVGTYGSGPLMSLAERKRVAEVVVDEVNKRVPVIVHVGAASTAETVELARHAESIGADAVGAIPPYYYRYTEDDLLGHFRAILEAVHIPVFAYNNPGLSNNPLTPGLLSKLAAEGLAGLKDSSFDLTQFYEFLNGIQHPGFAFIVGTEAIAAAAVHAGAQGIISGLANVWPEIMGEFWRELKSNDGRKAGTLQLRVLKARSILKYASTLVVCYEVLKMRGVNAGFPRKPYSPVDEGTRKRIREAFANMGLL